VVSFLLQMGADALSAGPAGSPLDIALKTNQTEIAECLREYVGHDSSSIGKSPFQWKSCRLPSSASFKNTEKDTTASKSFFIIIYYLCLA